VPSAPSGLKGSGYFHSPARRREAPVAPGLVVFTLPLARPWLLVGVARHQPSPLEVVSRLLRLRVPAPRVLLLFVGRLPSPFCGV
jgi:hypothetical protein